MSPPYQLPIPPQIKPYVEWKTKFSLCLLTLAPHSSKKLLLEGLHVNPSLNPKLTSSSSQLLRGLKA